MPRLLAALVLAATLAVPTAHAGSVTFDGPDGATLHAHHEGRGERGVVLLHADGRSKADWRALGETLVARGFQVLALDLRGHGATGGILADDGGPGLVPDVTQAAAWLRRKGATRVALIGAELGANLALHAGAADAGIDRVVMISPRLSVRGLKVSKALEGYGARPLLLVAGRDDASGVRAAEALDARAAGPHDLFLVDGDQGISLFVRSADLEGRLVAWLSTDDRADLVGGPREAALEASTVGEIRTTGKKLGED